MGGKLLMLEMVFPNPGTGTAYPPTALPTIGPYALSVPGFVPGSGSLIWRKGAMGGKLLMLEMVHTPHPTYLPWRRGHADAEARRSVLTALPCATLVTTLGLARARWAANS